MGHEQTATAEETYTFSAETFHPLGDRVLVEPLEEAEVTAGGIVLPDNVREKPQRGKVLAVGPGSRTVHGDVVAVGKDFLSGQKLEVGAIIVFARYGGTELKLGGDELVILREQDVLGVVSDDKVAF